MGPRPTHVCLVRETRLLPPKAGRLASRSAKPTLDGSSLTSPRPHHTHAPRPRTSQPGTRQARGKVVGVGHVFYLASNDAKTKHSAATKKN